MSDSERRLATVLFTDIVDSTRRAAELGDRGWREVSERHDALVRRELAAFGGKEVNTAGDGFVAAFEQPEAAVRCALAIRDGVGELGIAVRCGLHTGEVQHLAGGVGGIAVHIAARVVGHARSGEVLVSSTVRDLMTGSDLRFADRGAHALKGVPGEWRLFGVSAESAAVDPLTRQPILRSPALRRVAAAAAAILLIGAGLWWLARHRGVPSVQASPTAVAVLPFSVSGSDEYAYLSHGMVDLLSTKLDGAGQLRSVDPRAVFGLGDLEGAAVSDPARGRALANRLGAGLYILGNVVEAGGDLHVDASLYDPDVGLRPVARGTAEGEAARLFELVDDVVAQLLAGHSGGPAARVTRIAAVTTHSLPALKAYLQGETHLRAGEFRDAVEAFQAAVTQDSTFALAWYRLSLASEWATRTDIEARAAEQAFRHGARLAEHDRRLLEAFLAWRRGAAADAERRYRAIIASYPEDVEAWYQLGEVLFHYGPPQGRSIGESRQAWERVLSLEPDDVLSLMHVVRIAALEGDRSEVDSVMRRIVDLSPEGDRLLEVLAVQAFATGDSTMQERVLDQLENAQDWTVLLTVWNVALFTSDVEAGVSIARLMTDPARSTEGRARGHVLLAHLELAQGRFAAAKADLAAAEALDHSLALEYRALLTVAPFLGPPPAELSELRAQLSAWNAAQVPPAVTASGFFTAHDGLHPQLRLYLLGLVSARLADQAAALRYATELTQLGGPADAQALAQDQAETVRAQALWEAGRGEKALAALGRARRDIRYNLRITSGFYSEGHTRYVHAEYLAASGREKEALELYGTFEEHSFYDVVYQAPAHFRRAQIAERLGDRERAARHYARFVELWKGCDPELRGWVDQARARLGALKQPEAAA